MISYDLSFSKVSSFHIYACISQIFIRFEKTKRIYFYSLFTGKRFWNWRHFLKFFFPFLFLFLCNLVIEGRKWENFQRYYNQILSKLLHPLFEFLYLPFLFFFTTVSFHCLPPCFAPLPASAAFRLVRSFPFFTPATFLFHRFLPASPFSTRAPRPVSSFSFFHRLVPPLPFPLLLAIFSLNERHERPLHHPRSSSR